MNAETERASFRYSMFALAGLLIWLLHFTLVYAVNALACARGFAGLTVLGIGIVPLAVVLATIPAIVVTAIVLRAAIRRYRESRSAKDSSARFLSYIAATVAALSLVAIVWDALPALIIVPCA